MSPNISINVSVNGYYFQEHLIFQAIHLVLRAFGRFDKCAPLLTEASAARMSQRVSRRTIRLRLAETFWWEQTTASWQMRAALQGACDAWALSRGWAGCAVRARHFPLLFSCTVMPLPFNAAYPCWDAFRFSRVYLALVVIRLTMFGASSAKFMCLHVRSIVSHRSVDVTTVHSTCTGCFSTDGIL